MFSFRKNWLLRVVFTLLSVSLIALAFAGCNKNDGAANPTAANLVGTERIFASTSAGEAAAPVTPTPKPTPAPSLTPLPEGVILSESLTDGVTQGIIGDATFMADGLQMHNGEGFIRYSIPTTSRGYVEFDVTGLKTNEIHGGGEFKAVLLTMWDGNAPFMYEVNGYIYELRIFGLINGRPDASNTLSIRLISDYDWNEGHRSHYYWDRDRTYRIRLEWGNGGTTVFVDGEGVASSPIAREFRPANHQIQIGANMVAPYSHRWKQAPHNMKISNVVIGTL